MSVPLLAGGDLIGFIDLYNRESRPFAAVDAIVGLAQVAGQAIANARLYRELDQLLESEQAANQETQLLNEIAAAHGREPRPRGDRRAPPWTSCTS